MENSNVKLLLSLLLSGVLLMGCSRRAVQGESDAGRVKEINHGEKEEAVRLQDLSQAAIISMHKEKGNAEPTNIKRVTE